MTFFTERYPLIVNICNHSEKTGIVKNGKQITSKLNDKGVICMMLGYVTKNASGTYRILNLLRMEVLKSFNVKWLDMNYNQYVASKLITTVTRNNVESNDFF